MPKVSRAMNIITTSIFLAVVSIETGANTAKTGMRAISSTQLVADMGAGCNLGNTFDSKCPGLEAEVCWGNPYTSKAHIDKLAARGFKTLRLPVTWNEHLGPAPSYTIDKAWLDRVETVANYAFANDMYVIINTHHEGEWIKPTYANQTSVTDKLVKLWTQLATRFKDYGDYLIFETLNEPRLEGSAEEWVGGTAEGRDCVNQYHKACVDAIRATGGNNALRHLMITPYAASSTDITMNALVIPNNDPRTIVALHSYFPWLYCLEDVVNWGTAAEKAAMDEHFNKIYNTFIAKGHPVIMGEWGATNHNVIKDRLNHGAYYVKKCRERGICPVYWDNGKASEFGLINRTTLAWDYPDYADTMINAYKYRQCSPANQKYYISVNNSTFEEIDKVTVQRGDSLRLKVEFAKTNTAKWYLPNGTTTSTNELILNNVQLINAGTYAFVPTSTTTCNSSTSLNVNIKVYQAEEYTAQNGLSTEAATDAGGGLNIGYIQDGDWSSYTITIDKPGMYNFAARVATNTTGGTIECSVGDKLLGTTSVEDAKSNGWQDYYTTSPQEIALAAGTYELKLSYRGTASYLFNVNWFDLQYSRDAQFVELSRGWNLVSTYLSVGNDDVRDIFPNATTVKSNSGFFSPTLSPELNSLRHIEAGKGYMVYNTVEETVAIGGTSQQADLATLEQGWNLVGVPFSKALTIVTYSDAKTIKNFEGFYIPGNSLSTITDLEPGKAYFILK